MCEFTTVHWTILYSLADQKSGICIQLGVLAKSTAQSTAQTHDLLEEGPFLQRNQCYSLDIYIFTGIVYYTEMIIMMQRSSK